MGRCPLDPRRRPPATTRRLVSFTRNWRSSAPAVLRQRTGIAGGEVPIRKVLHGSRNALKVGFQFRNRAALPFPGLAQQRPALTGPEGCGLSVQRCDRAIPADVL